MGNSAQKEPRAKLKKRHVAIRKFRSSSREPQPEKAEEVYRALRQGLVEYSEVHQLELDKLKIMQRNSSPGVLYNLDKHIRLIERFICRLKFHANTVDELYEAFCLQRHLCDGASKMIQAFSTFHSTKNTRKCLKRLKKCYKEYSKNMCTFQQELEDTLGEFHFKMKGLDGSIQLCPGDKYKVFMRYGHQHWNLKGKIGVNSQQSWDTEEKVFRLFITELMSIKVLELKGLVSQVLVGSVLYNTKELFTAMPQVVTLNINDLQTIKLILEVTWFPLQDMENFTLSFGKKRKDLALQTPPPCVHSQGTQENPTFHSTAFEPEQDRDNLAIDTEAEPQLGEGMVCSQEANTQVMILEDLVEQVPEQERSSLVSEAGGGLELHEVVARCPSLCTGQPNQAVLGSCEEEATLAEGRTSAHQSHASSLNEILESPLASDFLSTSDFEDEDAGNDGHLHSDTEFFDTEPEIPSETGR
ncbi:rho family-interacting cell polarization regulator 2-like [Scleropages formosus]|uniref:Rho family-interacting cell polarization regulator 2 n=1 Tax=Scleropages formosus TaxID=113540 RepID=A0A8C9TCB7_SCLFO|nr:rho family-interacting cell polarization regulator 2-like [Scleropages formosus]